VWPAAPFAPAGKALTLFGHLQASLPERGCRTDICTFNYPLEGNYIKGHRATNGSWKAADEYTASSFFLPGENVSSQ